MPGCISIGARVGLGFVPPNIALRQQSALTPSSQKGSETGLRLEVPPLGASIIPDRTGCSALAAERQKSWMGSDDAIVAGMIWHTCVQVAGAEI